MAILSKGTTFATPTDDVTTTKLHNLVDAATFVTGATGTTDDSSLEVNGSGRLQIKDAGVTAAKLASGAVTTAKLPNSTLATDGVTYAKIQQVANMRALGNTSGALGVVAEIPILDEDTMVSDSATSLATQQSIKAYVDTEIAAISTFGTTQASTSGSTIDFTGLPATVKKIIINFVGVSTNGTSVIRLRLGDSGGVENTGYVGSVSSDAARDTSTDSFGLNTVSVASYVYSGAATLTRLSASVNTWILSGTLASDAGPVFSFGGYKTTSAELDRVRIIVLGDNFDAGSINIMYE